MKTTKTFSISAAFIIAFTVINVIVFPCWCILFQMYGYLNTIQLFGYILVFLGFGLNLIFGCVAVYTLLKKKKRAKLIKCICLLYSTPLLINLAAILLLPNYFSNGEQTRAFIGEQFKSKKTISHLMDMIQEYHSCCGVYSYKDYLQIDKQNAFEFDPLPDSCCTSDFRKSKGCASHLVYINMEGCFVMPGTTKLRAWYVPYFGTGFWWVMILPVCLFFLQMLTLFTYIAAYSFLDRVANDEFLIIQKNSSVHSKDSAGDNPRDQDNHGNFDENELAEIQAAARMIDQIEVKEKADLLELEMHGRSSLAHYPYPSPHQAYAQEFSQSYSSSNHHRH